MHQTTDGEVCHHQTVEFLPHQVWRLTAHHYLGATQMGFEFVQRSLYFPSLMIQRGQFHGWSSFMIENRREQAVDGVSTRNPFQSVFYDSNENSVFFTSLILLRCIHPAQIRSLWKPLLARQANVGLNSPEQISASATGTFPQFKAIEVPIRKAQHPLTQRRQNFLGKCDLPSFIAPHAGAEQDVCSILDQGYEPQLRKGAIATAGGRPLKSFLVSLLVGDIQRAPVQADGMPTLVPSTFSRFHRDRLYNFVVQLPNRFPSQACTSLRDSRFASHLDNRIRSHKPLDSFEKATQDFTVRRLHIQSQGDNIVDNHVRRQIPLPDAYLSGALKNSFNRRHRKGFSNYTQADEIG